MSKATSLFILPAIFLFFFTKSTAQAISDSLTLTLPQAEESFLQKNLLLIAQKYNIDASKALIVQARLFPNPGFSMSRGPLGSIKDSSYNPPNSNFFYNGETQVSVSQLILLAGKRNKQIRIAEANTKLAGYQFFDLLRTLKNTLRNDFFNIYYTSQSLQVYQKEITSLQTVVDAFRQQQGKGYISEKEVLRVRALLYSLQTERLALQNQLNDMESELRTILQLKPVYVIPVVDDSKTASQNPSQYPIATLIDSAYKNRTDLQIAKSNTDISRLNYQLQKALAVPDLTASLSYDKQGSYAHNLFSAGIAIDLPIFNRNQGNIQSAKSMIDMNAATEKSTAAIMEEQIYRSLQRALDNDKMYHAIDPAFTKDFDRLLGEVLKNYQVRNIGLLDFLDFYDSYKQNTLQINNIKFSRVSSLEAINFETGTNFFN